ncbi:MAG: HNH endonuclease [Alkalinema sp. RU_4_3]|nr:HNH endonuclease [Alkalinema sp. RU_4_3]
MADFQISASLRQQVIRRAFGCCEYCVSQVLFSPDPFSVEHTTPRAKGESNELDNLAFSCQGCNGHKHIATEAIDPINGAMTPLYNPRIHQWDEHFLWDEDFTIVVGRTAIGRAKVERLHLNREGVVNLRQMLRKFDRHPPDRSINP